MRDENPVFDRLKAIHDIGFPAIVKEDGTVFTDWETYLKEQGKEIIIRDGAACSIHKKEMGGPSLLKFYFHVFFMI